MADYSKDQLWKIYEMLPEELKDAIFSEETANNISLACSIAGLEDERVSQVARRTGHVLMGLLPLEEFQEELEKELEIEKSKAKKIAHQITRLVFNPVKESLALLYGEEKPGRTETATPSVRKVLQKREPEKKDIYRESIEES